MNVTAAALRELHRIHRQLTDLKDRLERGPKQVRAADAHVKRSELELAAAKESHTKTRVEADQKQLQLKGRETRISELKVKLNAANNNREYQALKEQIAADVQANSVLADEILEALEKIDTCQAAVATANSHLAKAREEWEKVKQRVDAAQAGLESEFARVSTELKQAELVLPEDFKISYQRVAKVRGEGALAQVEGEFCGGCNQTITSQMYSELRLSKPVFCKSCGCLLYLPEDRSPVTRGTVSQTADSLVRFAAGIPANTKITTMAQQKSFTVEVLGNALEVTPESGTPRRIGATEIESVWEKYRQTKSLKPGDYQQDSQNASYLLALIDLLLRD